jgi:hypothetical protein
MLRFHHVNLGVPVGGADAEAAFLVDFLAYQRVELTADAPPTARWFESEDGKQIHLSEDPDHRPAARAHVAVEYPLSIWSPIPLGWYFSNPRRVF